MGFPLKDCAIDSEQEPAIVDQKMVRTLLNQAEYQAFSRCPRSVKFGLAEQSTKWNFVPNGQPIACRLAEGSRAQVRVGFGANAHCPLRNGGAVGAFAIVNTKTPMPFSLPSYLLGVGTVVGALAFGFGGGVLLTKTAMKDAPVADTRVERVKRADSPSAAPRPVETVDTKAVPAPPPPAEPAPPLAAPASPVQASTDLPKAESPQAIAEVPKQPIAEAPRPAQPATAVESPPQTALVNPAETSTPSAEQRERELRKAEARRIERQKRDAERKAKAIAMARAKQRQFEERGEPSRPDYVYERSSRPALAFEREEPRFNSLDIPLFGRSREFSPIDRED